MKQSDATENVHINGKKIAMLVPNPCNPDYRVIKHAEFFASKGYEVRVYCRWAERLPLKQVINEVTYIRRPITIKSFIFAFIMSFFVKHELKDTKAQSTNSARP